MGLGESEGLGELEAQGHRRGWTPYQLGSALKVEIARSSSQGRHALPTVHRPTDDSMCIQLGCRAQGVCER